MWFTIAEPDRGNLAVLNQSLDASDAGQIESFAELLFCEECFVVTCRGTLDALTLLALAAGEGDIFASDNRVWGKVPSRNSVR